MPLVEFTSGAAAVDVFALVLMPSFLRAICSMPSFGISKFAIRPIPAKMPANWTAGANFYGCFNVSRKFSRENRNRTSALSDCYYLHFFRGAPGRNRTSGARNKQADVVDRSGGA